MRRREFITLLGGAAAMPALDWPRTARAQQSGPMRRVGVLMAGVESDPLWQGRAIVVREALSRLGWVEGRNLRIDLRYGGGDFDRLRMQAEEAVKLGPDVILTISNAAGRALQRATRYIPIVIAGLGPEEDSASALVRNIARPEGNITGFPILYHSIGGKWLELLKEAVPGVTRVAVVFNTETFSGSPNSGGYFASIGSAAHMLGLKTVNMPFSTVDEVEAAIDAFAAEPNGGLVVLPGAGTSRLENRRAIVLQAAKRRLPTMQWDKSYPRAGGVMSYGSDMDDLLRRGASYVDRILRGSKVNELPVQYPTRFDLVINLRTAKAIGLTIPETLLVRADEVIE
jgi:putative ABC transport system substrate-binding protein